MKTQIIFKMMAFVVVVALLTIVNGCTIAKISGRGSIPLMLNNPPQRVKVIEHFKADKMFLFDYTSSFDVSAILAKKLQQGNADAVTNLVVSVKNTAPSFLLNVVTFGLASAKVFSVEGDLVKIEGGMSGLLDHYEVIATSDTIDELNLESAITQRTSLVRLDDGFALVQPK